MQLMLLALEFKIHISIKRHKLSMTKPKLLQLSFHSCNYGIFIGRLTYSPWASFVHNCRSLLHQDNVGRITLHHYQFEYHRHRRLRACRGIRRVCFLCGVTLEYNKDAVLLT